jgi:hypothetical protein
MFTPDYNNNPELVSEMLKSVDAVAKNFKFRPLAFIWKPFRRNRNEPTVARPVAVRPTSTTLVEEC